MKTVQDKEAIDAYVFFSRNVSPCLLLLQFIDSSASLECQLSSFVSIIRFSDSRLEVGQGLFLRFQYFPSLSYVFEAGFVFFAQLFELRAFQEELQNL